MGTAIKHPVPDRVKPSFVIFDTQALLRSAPSVSARMSKITNNGVTRSGTECTHMATVGFKGLEMNSETMLSDSDVSLRVVYILVTLTRLPSHSNNFEGLI